MKFVKGWKGSAATSAFRPAEPRRTPERQHVTFEGPHLDAAASMTVGELATEIQELEKKRAELKNVNAALAAANGRRINIQGEREQFDEANVQIILHLTLKEEDLVRSVAARKTEASVVNAWTNFLEDTWKLQLSQIKQSEHAVEDALEEVNRQFLQFFILNLSTYKKDLDHFLEQIKSCIKAINDLSSKRSQVDESNHSNVFGRSQLAVSIVCHFKLVHI